MVFNQHPRGILLLLFVASFSIFVSPGFSRSVLNEELGMKNTYLACNSKRS